MRVHICVYSGPACKRHPEVSYAYYVKTYKHHFHRRLIIEIVVLHHITWAARNGWMIDVQGGSPAVLTSSLLFMQKHCCVSTCTGCFFDNVLTGVVLMARLLHLILHIYHTIYAKSCTNICVKLWKIKDQPAWFQPWPPNANITNIHLGHAIFTPALIMLQTWS